MWRNSKNVIFRVQSINRLLVQQHRGASGGSSIVGKAAKTLLWTTGAAIVGAGGTVCYAWYDPEFRRTVETNIPQSKDVFDAFLGDKAAVRPSGEPKAKPSSVPILSKSPSSESSNLPKPRPSDAIDSSKSSRSDSSSKVSTQPLKEHVDAKKLQRSEPVESAKPVRSEPIETPKPSRDLTPAPAENVSLQKANPGSEDELQKHLRRQAEAHSEHLVDVLRAQKAKLESQFQHDLDDAMIKERDVFNRELATSIARLHAIESALEGRAEQDSENRRAKELWLACQHLRKSVLNGRADGRDYSTRKKPLTKEIATIKDAGAADPFVKTLLNTISSEAVKEGVYTQDDLVNRFQHVKKVCRRTALIGENGGTLVQYFLSLMQSFFLFDRVKPEPIDLVQIDPANADTVGILWRASYLVEQLNFEDAIKLMQLLKGEPARVASDWIKDARLHLETRRTAELLLAHASAVSMRTIY